MTAVPESPSTIPSTPGQVSSTGAIVTTRICVNHNFDCAATQTTFTWSSDPAGGATATRESCNLGRSPPCRPVGPPTVYPAACNPLETCNRVVVCTVRANMSGAQCEVSVQNYSSSTCAPGAFCPPTPAPVPTIPARGTNVSGALPNVCEGFQPEICATSSPAPTRSATGRSCVQPEVCPTQVTTEALQPQSTRTQTGTVNPPGGAGGATGSGVAGATTARAAATAVSPGAAGTTTQLVLASKRVVTGEPLTVRVTVAPIPDGGTVSFLADGRALPGCVAVPANTSTGATVCVTRFPRAGQIAIQAVYSGDPTFAASQATGAVETVIWSVTLNGSPTGSGAAATTTLSCAVASGACPVTVALTESAPGSAATGSPSPAARVVGANTITIQAGGTAPVTVKLNQLGRQLLARRGRLDVEETIFLTTAGVRAAVASTTLTIVR